MKFNERLIELRKKEGLSQEDLGYKLNVTRQTVSKWELGITTPEMEKLVEMSKLFNISVDELIKEDSVEYNSYNTYDSNYGSEPIDGVITGNSGYTEPVKEKKKKTGWIVALVIGLLLIIIVPCILVGSIFSSMFSGVSGIFGMAGDIFNTSTEMINDITNTVKDQIDDQMNTTEDATGLIKDTMNIISEGKEQIDTKRYNGTIELFLGTVNGTFVRKIIDEVTTINQTEEKKITVKFMDKETQDVAEIREMKKSITDEFEEYEAYCDYDEDGYISKITIEKLEETSSNEDMLNDMETQLDALKNMLDIDM